MTEFIQTSVDDGVQIIRINRPDKKNALNTKMYAAMAKGLNEAGASDDIRTSLILGCPGIFCAGNDIGDFIQAASAGPEAMQPVFDFLEAIITSAKPLVAGVDGKAIGVGTTMLMHCDFVVASTDASFKTPFVDLGLVPEAGSSLAGPILMGHHRAFELLAMGEACDAEKAMQSGFVNRIVPAADVEKSAIEIAQTLAAKPPQAMKLSRDLIRGDRSALIKRMQEEAKLFSKRLESDEARAAFMAFMSKGQKS